MAGRSFRNANQPTVAGPRINLTSSEVGVDHRQGDRCSQVEAASNEALKRTQCGQRRLQLA